MDLSQTFRICIWVFTQHILQIILKQLVQFNRYSKLNFKVQFFKWTCSYALNIFKKIKSNVAQLFINSSNISVMIVSCVQHTQGLLDCSKCSPVIHDQSLLQNDMIAIISINSCIKSPNIISKTILKYVGQIGCVSLTVLFSIASHPLAYQSDLFYVIFTSESQFN